jgi:hypothetical protein
MQSSSTRVNQIARSPREKVDAGFAEIRQSTVQLSVAMEKAYGESNVAMIADRVWRLAALGGILLLIARASNGFEAGPFRAREPASSAFLAFFGL